MYEKFSEVYEQVFPLKKETAHFLTQHLRKGSILDVACGTGNYANYLDALGYKVEAIDLSPSMIERAKTQYKESNVSFKVASMETLDTECRYDGLYCIGNSLVHLHNEEAILDVVKRFYNALKHGGNLVIQIINYERIYGKNITALPTIKKGEVEFKREYTLYKDWLDFRTTLTTEGERSTSSTRLFPLKPSAFKSLLKKAGFKTIRFYGDFTGTAFDEMLSVPLIVSATKV